MLSFVTALAIIGCGGGGARCHPGEAIDGGGTKTLFLLAEADGTVIGIGRGGPLNALFVPPDEAIRSVRQAAVGALSEAGMECTDVLVLYASAPGASRDIVDAGISGLIRPTRLDTAGDELAVLTGALLDEAGVVVLAGTGSFAVGRGGRRDRRDARGLGRLRPPHRPRRCAGATSRSAP